MYDRLGSHFYLIHLIRLIGGWVEVRKFFDTQRLNNASGITAVVSDGLFNLLITPRGRDNMFELTSLLQDAGNTPDWISKKLYKELEDGQVESRGDNIATTKIYLQGALVGYRVYVDNEDAGIAFLYPTEEAFQQHIERNLVIKCDECGHKIYVDEKYTHEQPSSFVRYYQQLEGRHQCAQDQFGFMEYWLTEITSSFNDWAEKFAGQVLSTYRYSIPWTRNSEINKLVSEIFVVIKRWEKGQLQWYKCKTKVLLAVGKSARYKDHVMNLTDFFRWVEGLVDSKNDPTQVRKIVEAVLQYGASQPA